MPPKKGTASKKAMGRGAAAGNNTNSNIEIVEPPKNKRGSASSTRKKGVAAAAAVAPTPLKPGNISNANTKKRARKERKQAELNTFRASVASITGIKPGWYHIPEIELADFVYCVQRLYKLIEGDLKEYGTYDDEFAKAIFKGQMPGATPEAWRAFEKQRRFADGLSARLGDFHEELAGKFPGFRTLHTGHWSGLDVMSEDRKVFLEFKNRGTISTAVKKTVLGHFKDLLDKYKEVQCVLVHVNVPADWKPYDPVVAGKEGSVDLRGDTYKGRVHIIDGRRLYTVLSGKADFYDRLLQTMTNAFQDKRFTDFIEKTAATMDEA